MRAGWKKNGKVQVKDRRVRYTVSSKVQKVGVSAVKYKDAENSFVRYNYEREVRLYTYRSMKERSEYAQRSMKEGSEYELCSIQYEGGT
jgi:hypothetical protein